MIKSSSFVGTSRAMSYRELQNSNQSDAARHDPIIFYIIEIIFIGFSIPVNYSL